MEWTAVSVGAFRPVKVSTRDTRAKEDTQHNIHSVLITIKNINYGRHPPLTAWSVSRFKTQTKKMLTTTPNRIRKWSPTLLLTGRYPGCLRRSDGMRNFLDSMVVDRNGLKFGIMNYC